MKKSAILLACLLFFAKAHSQTALFFCAYVNESGNCFMNNNQFIASPDSTVQRIFMQAEDPRTFSGTSKVIFKVYTVGKNGVETYDSSSEQNVQNDWIFAWTPYSFKAPGTYKVKVFNDRNQLLCEKGLTFFAGK